MTTQTTIEHLQEAVAALKFRAHASNKLGEVRSIEETDERTLDRIVSDYQKIVNIVYERASYEERKHLDDKWPGTLPDLIKKMLEELPLAQTARAAHHG